MKIELIADYEGLTTNFQDSDKLYSFTLPPHPVNCLHTLNITVNSSHIHGL
jgi:hypothetical protein